MSENLKARSVHELPFSVEQVVARARTEYQAIILVTGVFDILHEEHIKFLHKAKELGGVLIVGLESDVRVRQMKGADRPVNTEDKRLAQVVRIGVADAVFILPEEFGKPEQNRALIHHLRPKYLAVSSHTAHLEAKRKILAEVGGEVAIVHQHNPAISTTQLLAAS